MATGGRPRRRDKKEGNEPGIGTMLAVGVGAIGVAALAYGAKKLYDMVTTEVTEPGKKIPEDDDSEEYRHSTQTMAPSPSRSDTAIPPEPSVPRVLPQEVVPPKCSLSDQLSDYYLNYVRVNPADEERAMSVAEDIKCYLTELLRKHPSLDVSNLIGIGSAFENLAVIAPSEFDFLIPVVLPSEYWCVSDVDTVTPGYRNVRQKHRAADPHPLNECLRRGILSPGGVTGMFMTYLHDAIAQLDRYQVDTYMDKSAIVLHVLYGRNSTDSLNVNLYPALCLQGSLLVSRPHPAAGRDSAVREMWQESFSTSEARLLCGMDPAQTCHLQCLQIIKAIRLNHPAQFGALPSYAYKTILLHMMRDNPEADFWRPECLPEQFVDMLNELIYFLQGRNLPHHFNERVNLLEDVSSSSCSNLVSFITTRIGKEKLHTLLEQRHLSVLI